MEKTIENNPPPHSPETDLSSSPSAQKETPPQDKP